MNALKNRPPFRAREWHDPIHQDHFRAIANQFRQFHRRRVLTSLLEDTMRLTDQWAGLAMLGNK